MLHGAAASNNAEKAGKALFNGDIAGLDAPTLHEVFANVPSSTHQRSELRDGHDLIELLVTTNLASSKREAREFLSAGSVLINGVKATMDGLLHESDLLFDSTIALRRGKKNWHITRWE